MTVCLQFPCSTHSSSLLLDYQVHAPFWKSLLTFSYASPHLCNDTLCQTHHKRMSHKETVNSYRQPSKWTVDMNEWMNACVIVTTTSRYHQFTIHYFSPVLDLYKLDPPLSDIIWNSLPLDIRNSSTISCFRRQLKTFFYKAAFRPPYNTIQYNRIICNAHNCRV